MREREKLRETFHSHPVTQRHVETQKERDDIQLDAMIRTQTDSLGDKHLETERLSKYAYTLVKTGAAIVEPKSVNVSVQKS